MTKVVITGGCVSALLVQLLLSPTTFADPGDTGFARLDGDIRPPAFQAHVTTDSSGVNVEISGKETVDGAPGGQQPAARRAQAAGAAAPAPAVVAAPSADAGPTTWSNGSDYHRVTPGGQTVDYVQPSITPSNAAYWNDQSANHVGEAPFLVVVDNQLQGVRWMPDQANINPSLAGGLEPPPPPDTPPAGDGGSHDPHEVAVYLLTHMPLPAIKLRMNPTLGMVAMPGWFWVDGYNGDPIQQSRTVTLPPPAPGLPPTSFTVTVRIWPSKYDWSFGDGASVETHSLGKPYPAESDITHTYQFSSLSFPTGFAVRCTVEWAAEYHVNGGGPQGLPPIHHTYENDFRVQELQPVLTK
jgi:hypothetical protein